MRYAPRALLAGGLGFAASFLVACGGGSGLLSTDQASTLNGQLDQISSAVNSGQCGAAASAVTGFSNAVQNLPGSVNSTLISNLEQGATVVSQLAAKDCANPPAKTTPTTSTTSTSTSTTSTTSSSTTPTSTSTSTTSTVPPPPTTTSATSSTSSGTSTTTGNGGAGLSGTGGNGGSGTGNGNGQ